MRYTLIYNRSQNLWSALDSSTGETVAQADTKESVTQFMHAHGWKPLGEEAC